MTAAEPEALVVRIRAAVTRRQKMGWAFAAEALAATAALPDQPDPVEAERLDVLALRFGLTPVETDLIRVALIAERSTAGHLVLGLLSGDDGPARPSVALGLELAGLVPSGSLARTFLSGRAPLRRRGLIDVKGDDVQLSRRLAVPDRVAEHLAAVDTPAAWVLQATLAPFPAVDLDTDSICHALTGDQPLVWIHAPAGTAGAMLAVAACRDIGAPPWVFDLGRLPRELPPDRAVGALLLESALAGAVPVFLHADRVPAAAFFEGVVPVLAVSEHPWDPAWAEDIPVTVAAPTWTAEGRRRIWQQLELGAAVNPDILAMPLAAEQIGRVARHAERMAMASGETEVRNERLRASVRQLGRSHRLRASAGSGAGLDDLVLPPHAMDEIRRLLDWARCRDEVFGTGGAYTRGGKGTGICALFSGPPGTGKTLAAHVVADSLGLDLFQVDLSSTVDKYIGETEKNLERIFAEAEAINAVLFFDEADALFGSRSEVRDARDRYANQEIAYLLQRMESFDGITVLASNLRGNIDPAFARRLQFIVAFPDPDVPTRIRLWEHHLRPLPIDPDDPVRVAELAAAVDLTGGDIRNIVLSAHYAAVADGRPVGMRHIEAAVGREYRKLGRRQTGAPTRRS